MSDIGTLKDELLQGPLFSCTAAFPVDPLSGKLLLLSQFHQHNFPLGGYNVNQVIHAITVNNNSFGALNGTTIYITQDLFDRFNAAEGTDNRLTLSSLQNGRALRGLKHLMERLNEKRRDSELVLTLGATRREPNRFFINFDDYRQSTQGKFYQMYRSVGLEASLDFLIENFSADFEEEGRRLAESRVDAAQRELPELVTRLGQRERNRPDIMDGASHVVRSLTGQGRLRKRDIEALLRLRSATNIAHYRAILNDLRDRLYAGKRYDEVRGANSWQKWIRRNSWLFGPMYLDPIDRSRVDFQDIPDFLFPTLDGFMDILEIKLPTKNVIVSDRNRYYWSADTNRAIGQVTDYIHKMDRNQLLLTQNINRTYSEQLGGPITVLRPRAFILIGIDDGWTEREREGHRLLNYALHGIEVMTYNELLRRGECVVELYERSERLPVNPVVSLNVV